MLVKYSSDVGYRSVGIIGGAFNKNGDPMWSVSFKRNLIVTICICTRCLLYCSFYIIFRHVLTTSVLYGVTLRCIRFWILVVFFFLYSYSFLFVFIKT